MYQAITFVSTLLAIILILLIFKNKSEKSFSKFLKVLTIVYCVLGFFRFMLSDSFVYVIKGGYFNYVYYDRQDILQSILRWGYYIGYSVLPMAVFFKNRFFRNMASYIFLPFAVLSTIFFDNYMVYFLSEEGNGLHLVPWIRYAYFIIELALSMIIPIVLQIKEKHVLNIKDKKELIYFFVGIPLIFLQVMPVYIPQSLFGYTGIEIHIPWLIIIAIETIALYYYFRFKSYDTRYQLVVFLTIVLFYHYDSLYLQGFSIPRLPIQLCNMAAYFYIIAVIFKNQKMFNFCYIVNMVGTLIAILAPDLNDGPLGFWNMHYMFEHMLVFIIPVLCAALRLFPRVDKKALKHMFVGFVLYFVFCLTSGVLLNAYGTTEMNRVNYFYLFSLDKATSYIPFIKFVDKFPITINGFTFYPLLMAIIFVSFLTLCFVWYWLTQKLFVMNDDHFELRKARIDLYEKITGKKSKAMREYPE